MTAKQMFAQKGYEQTTNDENAVMYKKKSKDRYTEKRIVFKKKGKEFMVEWEECFTGAYADSVDLEELKAIIKQAEELNWL
ncbi:MAG: hypothetical protein GYA87_09395 [Christensenellaceae bacterium]|nr:hypothetical protein [Christensenellaceae bacterium]